MAEPYKPYSHRRFWENPCFVSIPCNRCEHYHGFAKCDAYPERIPREITTMEIDVKAIPECAPGYKYEEKRGK